MKTTRTILEFSLTAAVGALTVVGASAIVNTGCGDMCGDYTLPVIELGEGTFVYADDPTARIQTSVENALPESTLNGAELSVMGDLVTLRWADADGVDQEASWQVVNREFENSTAGVNGL